MQLHEDQLGQIRLNNDLSELFPIFNGMKQGCVLAPTLFSTFFSMMLRQATVDLDDECASVLSAQQPIQPMAPSSPHQDPGKADVGPPLHRRCCSCHPHRKSPAVHHNLLCGRCSSASRSASRRLRFLTSPLHRKPTIRPCHHCRN